MFLCPGCHRHVRESVCPFCRTAQKGAPLAGPSAVRIGMKRSAVLAAVAAIGTGVGCGGSVESRPTADAAADVVAPGTDYGIPVMEDAAPRADAGPEDAPADATPAFPDASTPHDAQPDDVFAAGTDYGIPPFSDGGPP